MADDMDTLVAELQERCELLQREKAYLIGRLEAQAEADRALAAEAAAANERVKEIERRGSPCRAEYEEKLVEAFRRATANQKRKTVDLLSNGMAEWDQENRMIFPVTEGRETQRIL